MVRNDCRFYRGDMPCQPHKQHGVHCPECGYYSPAQPRVLIIKLGAAGDVIRSTPLITALKARSPQSHITWLTLYPVFVPSSKVDTVLKWNWENVLALQAQSWDEVYCLDKDRPALALAHSLQANVKKGFLPDNYGNAAPADKDGEHKWLTGLWDDLCRANTKGYPQELLEACGFVWQNQEYLLDIPVAEREFDIPKGTVIGLNTGCGKRWLSRLWSEEHYTELIGLIKEQGWTPLLLGGPDEHEKNLRLAASTGAIYHGTMPLEDFIHLVNKCSAMVTSVTMALHLALALGKKIVLLNNIFNRHEFFLYNRGVILEPERGCLCCYKNYCENDCLNDITPETVMQHLRELL